MKTQAKLFGGSAILFAAALTVSSCSKAVYINTMRPAEITFPAHVNTILLVNRSEFDKKGWEIAEGVLTGELPGEDKAGIQEVMGAFQQQLMASPRFKVKRASEALPGNSLTGAFPEPLSWSQVERLCRNYQADAVVAIEIYDTDFIVTNGKRDVTKEVVEKDGSKRQVKTTEFYAEGVANVKVGFRLYDPKERTIADQQLFNPNNSWTATGTSAKDALSHLIQKTEAARYVSRVAGANYATKIAPMPIQLSRFFYAKAKHTPALAQGARYAEVGQWDLAVQTWRKSLTNPTNRKDAGKLAYNLAVGYEVLGDFEKARDWASRAYVNYDNKKGRSYTSLLDQRMRDNELLREQGL